VSGARTPGGPDVGGGWGATHAADSEHPEQPTRFEFDAESEAQIERVLKRYPPGKQASAVIPLLYVVQRQMGRQTGSAWVPRVAMDEVAERLGMAPIRVYEVATF
jgi:NADH-quinone oxidoreductase subunit E